MKNKRFMIVADTHGSHIDWQAAAVALQFRREFKPHDTFHLGDWINVGKHRRGASSEEKRESLKEDVAMGFEFMAKLDPTALIKGNHDARIDDQVEAGNEDAELWAEKIDGFFDRLGTIVVPHCKVRGWHRYGNHLLGHGFSGGLHAAMTHAAYNGQHTITGHVHYNSGPVAAKMREHAWGYTCGCLCHLDQDYNRKQMGAARQNHGFVYGYKLPCGRLDVRHAMIDSNYNLLLGDY